MKRKDKDVPLKTQRGDDMTPCHHHWDIERVGLKVRGRCRFCGEVRDFDNIMPFEQKTIRDFSITTNQGVYLCSYIPVLHQYECYVY